MNRVSSIIFAVVIAALTACDNASSPAAAEKTVTRDIKGTEIKIVAPASYVPVCEQSIAVWTSINSSMPEAVHLLTCFIRQGKWRSPDEISVDDLYPIMTVAIYKNMINESLTDEEFSGMLKVIKKPVDESAVVLNEQGVYCYSSIGRKHNKTHDKEEEFDVVVVNCLTLVRDKYLLLTVEDKLPNDLTPVATQQLAKDWVRLMRDAN